MEKLRFLNLLIHIGAGSLGILVGLVILWRTKGTEQHRRSGRIFAWLALITSASALLSSALFDVSPLFVVLSVLATYQLVSGWREVRRKAAGPSAFDAAWTLAAWTATVLLLPVLAAAPTQGHSRPVVIWSTLAALLLVLIYDTVRWVFPRTYYARLWPYGHVYKLVASFSALLSAFVGNVIRFGQPWSQLLPSLLCTALVVVFFLHLARPRGLLPQFSK